MTGRISSSSAHGINVRTDFFDEIFIPHHYLFEGSTFDVKENVWVWNNDGNEFYLDKNEVIRFRVEEEKFEDQLPVPPHLKDALKEQERTPAYRIIVSDTWDRPGLGANEDRHRQVRRVWDWCPGGRRMRMPRVRRRNKKLHWSCCFLVLFFCLGQHTTFAHPE